MRRAAVQVSQEEAKDDQASTSQSKSTGKVDSPAAAAFAGFGVAPKKGGVFALDKDVFWFAKQSKDRFRWNLLNPFPLLRKVGRTSRAEHSNGMQGCDRCALSTGGKVNNCFIGETDVVKCRL